MLPPLGPPLGLTLGLTTCYDMRFPELYMLLRERGAEVMLVPSAFTVPTGRAHWELLLRTRVVETQCFVMAAAQVGQHNEKRVSWGHALIVDPWGVVLADAGGFDDGFDDLDQRDLDDRKEIHERQEQLDRVDPVALGASSCSASEEAAAAAPIFPPPFEPKLAPKIAVARLDLERLREVREKMPILNR